MSYSDSFFLSSTEGDNSGNVWSAEQLNLVGLEKEEVQWQAHGRFAIAFTPLIINI